MNFTEALYLLSERLKHSTDALERRFLRIRMIRIASCQERLKHENAKTRLVKSYLSKEFQR